jgi:hypothetical protein
MSKLLKALNLLAATLGIVLVVLSLWPTRANAGNLYN